MAGPCITGVRHDHDFYNSIITPTLFAYYFGNSYEIFELYGKNYLTTLSVTGMLVVALMDNARGTIDYCNFACNFAILAV